MCVSVFFFFEWSVEVFVVGACWGLGGWESVCIRVV